MALHFDGLPRQLHALLVDIRCHLVGHRLQSRRLSAGEHEQWHLHPLHPRQQELRLRLPLQCGDPAHHRLWIKTDDRGVSRGHHHAVSPEHRGCDHPGVHGWGGVRQAGQTQEASQHRGLLKVCFDKHWLVKLAPRWKRIIYIIVNNRNYK